MKCRGVARVFFKGDTQPILAGQTISPARLMYCAHITGNLKCLFELDIHIFTMVNYSQVKQYCTTVSFTFYHFINSIFVYSFAFCLAYINTASKLMYFE